jgi:hypothetical protein
MTGVEAIAPADRSVAFRGCVGIARLAGPHVRPPQQRLTERSPPADRLRGKPAQLGADRVDRAGASGAVAARVAAIHRPTSVRIMSSIVTGSPTAASASQAADSARCSSGDSRTRTPCSSGAGASAGGCGSPRRALRRTSLPAGLLAGLSAGLAAVTREVSAGALTKLSGSLAMSESLGQAVARTRAGSSSRRATSDASAR